MHLSHNNRKIKYEMGGLNFNSTVEKNDLGVILSEKLQVGKQCLKAANEANQMLGMIKIIFVSCSLQEGNIYSIVQVLC